MIWIFVLQLPCTSYIHWRLSLHVDLLTTKQHHTCCWVSILKKSWFFAAIFLCFLSFLRNCSTQAKTVLECSSLCTNVSILWTFIVRRVSEEQSFHLTCTKMSLLFSIFFCVTRLPKLYVKGPKFSWVSRVSRDWELTVLRLGWVDSKVDS
jgi:hypothetical protein